MQTEKIEINIRKIELGDLENFKKWNHPSRLFHRYNGPYFKIPDEKELDVIIKNMEKLFGSADDDVLKSRRMIVDSKTDELIGQVNWYWKSPETNWMEIGIVIFNEEYWGYGIGKDALKMWIEMKFKEHPELVRIGLSTWSGNERMMKLAISLGLNKEAEYRSARIVDGKYYDSLSYGIIKEDWLKLYQ